jgi:hypothetical protein
VSEAVVARLVATSPNSERPICRAIVVSERTTPMTYILGFMNRVRQANRRIAAFPYRDHAEEWIARTRADFPARVAGPGFTANPVAAAVSAANLKNLRPTRPPLQDATCSVLQMFVAPGPSA